MSKTSDRQVEQGIAEVVERDGNDRYQWGQYIERNDGRDGKVDWLPLIYDADEETARQWCASGRHEGESFRNSRLVRRAVGPWEIVPERLGSSS